MAIIKNTMFIFKTKKQKQKRLEDSLNLFIERNKDYFNSYCYNGKDVIIYHKPHIINNCLVLEYTDETTPDDLVRYADIWFLELKYGENFMKSHRNKFMRLKSQMGKLGINIEKKVPKQELKDEHMVYFSDDMYLPIHYKSIKVKQPFYPGDGNLSVGKLQELCNQFQEYCHQQQVIKQNVMKHLVELKFNVTLSKETDETELQMKN